jgi:hypothetical protein
VAANNYQNALKTIIEEKEIFPIFKKNMNNIEGKEKKKSFKNKQFNNLSNMKMKMDQFKDDDSEAD